MKYTLPKLPYEYDALEPYIDAKTMELHYSKHHQKYVDELNAALEKEPELEKMPLVELLQDIHKYKSEAAKKIRNNGGGHMNHTLFWTYMSPKGGGNPTGDVATAIKKSFGTFTKFQAQFNYAAEKEVFGSGWAWLCLDESDELIIATTANQDNPVMYDLRPIFGLDVWEHAYYLKYHNKRPDYIQAWWNVVNWDQIGKYYHEVKNV